ncbi:GumC family protein [Pseudaminobacter soli (ex Li et al. 2025)]|uniref:Exopolysaccharide biosynthesis protein n=1 Tax=Pseudaminobacter soli (ex Li et al. 2025) TaxID=1295366 RepID=A0A2P7SG86_9HYPH|nr:polysaccharide biosynthesis tyrosine autokinase [Mesorhizobium soli]PSJ61509.1 exopolysaccharide biosynthesis protein [Mesorhizobium soli]
MLDRSYPLPNYGSLPPYGDVQSYQQFDYHPYGDDKPEREGLLDPLKLLSIVVRHRWLIAFMVLFALVGGFVVTMMQTPIYQSSARLEVVTPSARVFQDIEVVSETSDQRAFLTAREKIMSRAIAERVVYQLGLADKRDFLYPAPSFSPWNLARRAFGLKLVSEPDLLTSEERKRIAVERVLGAMSVNLVPNTSLLTIAFRDQKPEYARDVANQITQSFIDQRVDQTGETSELARQFIQEQVLQVKVKLQASEQALVDYARKAGITVTGSERSLIASNIEAINTALAKAMEDRLERNVLVSQIELGRGDSLEQVLASEPLQKLRTETAQLKAEYQQKLTTFKPGFPEMRQLQTRIGELERQYADGVAVILDGIRKKRDEAVKREGELRAKLAELEQGLIAYEDKNIQYTILKREVDSNRSQYETLITKLNTIGVGSELKSQNATIVDLAVLSKVPVAPRLSINLAIALTLFMALSAAIIYLLELLNNSFVNPEQIEKELGLSVLGILPKVDAEDLEASLADQKSGLSKAYRSLRTSIQFSGAEGMPRTLVITSSEPSETKSTSAYKIALDFGVIGKKVLIIDGDLRKPSMHRLFGLDNTLGLSNILTNSVPREDLPRTIRKTRESNIWVVTSGTIPPNPADLLSSAKMALLVEYFAGRFDLVIIDSPPVVGLSDAPILSRIAQATLLLVSANNVSRKSAKSALKRLRAAGGNVIGACLARFSAGTFDYNYAYRYMNYYYYQYGHELPKLEGQGGTGSHAERNRTFLDRLGHIARSSVSRLIQRLKPVD